MCTLELNNICTTQGQRGQRAGDVVRGQHLPRVGGDAAARGRVGRQRGARALPAAPPARHAPPQAPLHAAPQAHEVSRTLLHFHFYCTFHLKNALLVELLSCTYSYFE